MPLELASLENMLNDAFVDADIKIIDLAGDNDHWSVEISAKEFVGKTRVQQHKMVYSALNGKMGDQLHAMQLKTSVKNEGS